MIYFVLKQSLNVLNNLIGVHVEIDKIIAVSECDFHISNNI